MKRPSFQFYPGDWKLNAKLRRCSLAARGAWIEILCVLHDEEEYGLARYPLAELADAASVPLALAEELVAKAVLKGSDSNAVPYVYRPRHAGQLGDPVTLVEPNGGPVWFSSRMVEDEWRRGRQGAGTRFTADHQPVRSPKGKPDKPPTRSPSRRVGERLGDGATSSSSSSSSVAKATAAGTGGSVSPAPGPDGANGAAGANAPANTPPPGPNGPTEAAGGPAGAPARPRPSSRAPASLLPPDTRPVLVRAAENIAEGLTPEERRKRLLWRAAKFLIEDFDGIDQKRAGTILGQLHGKYPDVFLDAIEVTSAEGSRPGGGYVEYLTATCQHMVGERERLGNKAAVLEAGADATRDAWVAKKMKELSGET